MAYSFTLASDDRLFTLLLGWFIGRLIDWLIDWLIDCLIIPSLSIVLLLHHLPACLPACLPDSDRLVAKFCVLGRLAPSCAFSNLPIIGSYSFYVLQAIQSHRPWALLHLSSTHPRGCVKCFVCAACIFAAGYVDLCCYNSRLYPAQRY